MSKSRPKAPRPPSPELRRRAEDRLERRRTAGPADAGDDPRRLVHELEVHQIELEMQNEELRASRREVEAGLRRYACVFDFAPVGYFVLAPDGTVGDVNLAGARLVGVERRNLVGRRISLFVAETDRTAFADFLSRVTAKSAEESETCEVALLQDGAWHRDARLTGTMLVEPGRAPMLLLAAEDVTARKRAEAAVRDESRHKDEFLAALSHELRNPLAAIRSGLYLMEHAPAGSAAAQKACAVVDRQVGHLTRLVDDLLDATRIARGKIELRRQRVELGDLVQKTVEDHRPAFEREGIELTASVARQRLWVDADPTRLVQALDNLLTNAAKFTNRGGRVEVEVRNEGERGAVSVRDNGMGIAPEVQAHLFAPFRQGPQNVERSRGGLGLGLAVVKGLVELHGGTVRVASAGVGKGSTFTIGLPLEEAPEEASAPQDAAVPSGGDLGHAGQRRCRVLVIEDNVDAADTLREALEIAGHDVRSAYDGPTGLARAREFHPEVVICDIGLPGISGYDVARAIQNDRALGHTFLVALSGYGLPEDVRRTTEAGFHRHLVKPPDVDQLEALIAEACAPERPHGVEARPQS